MPDFTVHANLVDIDKSSIYEAKIEVSEGKIYSIRKLSAKASPSLPYACPGFIDSHVHIESSMLIPAEFAKLAVVHGTIATISDPHEIANVCGIEGVNFMIDNGKTVPFHFYFGAPSCVPATIFETAGASIDADAIDQLMTRREIVYLSEMMNFPGVLAGDEEIIRKIMAAKRHGKPVDGHAPGLTGDAADKYIAAGMSTDHECFTSEEALYKLEAGMKILIREGSAARNFDALIDLLPLYPKMMMFCSDDKHPDSLVAGHINQLCTRALNKGINLFDVLRAACINPVEHYKLNTGLLRMGDPADFILLHNLQEFNVYQTYIQGTLVAENGNSLIHTNAADSVSLINNFSNISCGMEDLRYPVPTGEVKYPYPIIKAEDGQLITRRHTAQPAMIHNCYESDTVNDILKIVVVNRYRQAPVAKAFINGFGLKEGAIASSVAHDSHNIVAVGVDDKSLQRAIQLIINARGGISCIHNSNQKLLALPAAGLMSNEDGYQVANQYTDLDAMAKRSGSTLASPFMTLSFMALLVIPHLKLSDRGLFDGDEFKILQNVS